MVDVEESRVVHTCACVRTRMREGEEESNASGVRRGERGRRAGGGLREARRERREWKKEGGTR